MTRLAGMYSFVLNGGKLYRKNWQSASTVRSILESHWALSRETPISSSSIVALHEKIGQDDSNADHREKRGNKTNDDNGQEY